MSTKIIDISVPINSSTIVWPGSDLPKIREIKSITACSDSNDTMIEMGSHIGTHVDAPLHFIDKANSVDQLPLDLFMGEAYVVEFSKVKEITEKELEEAGIPEGTKRLLIKTSNTLLWKKKTFDKEFVALTSGAAKWLVKRKFKIVGVDYLSVAKFNESKEVHRILLSKKMALLEGINLSKVRPGSYMLMALPVKILGTEAAPVRAVLLEL
jgi:arylformamidase